MRNGYDLSIWRYFPPSCVTIRVVPEVASRNLLTSIRREVKSQRVFLRVLGRPFLRALVVPIFTVMLSVAMADAVIDWSLLRSRIESGESWKMAGLMTAVAVAWSVTCGRAFRTLWHQPSLAFLARQPLGPWRWIACLSPSLAPALIPIAGIAWLAPQHVDPATHYFSYLALAWPIVVGASFAGREGFVIVVGGSLAFFVTLFAESALPLIVYAAPVLALIQMRLSVTPIRRQVAQVNRRIYSPLSGSGVIATIVRRDLRYLIRRQRKGLAGLTVVSALTAAMMLAFRVNGGQQGQEALLSACMLFTVSASGVYEILEAMKRGLGKELMRCRWPVTHSQRALALIALIVTLIGLPALAILLFASTMGAAFVLVYVLFVAGSIIMTAALFATLLVAQRSANGFYLLLITVHMILVLALPVWGYSLLVAVLIPPGFVSIGRGFSRFTSITERITIGQLA